MGSGLSMTSVNKIKELAEAREYSLAVEILDSQDLSKSLNPQFIRLCGTIYTQVGRYKDARRMLLMAHKIAPEAKRVIQSLAYLYMRVGYGDLAKRYYDIYMHDADMSLPETKQLMYWYNKYKGASCEELHDFILPYYQYNIDYDWTYEAILLLHLQGHKDEARMLIDDYKASFRDTDRALLLGDIGDSTIRIEDEFYIFPNTDVADDDPDEDSIRAEELILLRADDLRINPPEPEITIMVDDTEEEEISSKRMLKKFLKEEKKKAKLEAKKKKKEESMAEDANENIVEDNADEVSEDTVSEVSSEDTCDTITDDVIVATVDEEAVDEEVSETEVEEVIYEETVGTEVEEVVEDSFKYATTDEYTEEYYEAMEEPDEWLEATDDGELDMREIHIDKQTLNNKADVSIEFGDEFEAEADTVEGLKDSDFSNPFDSISAYKQDSSETKRSFDFKLKSDISYDEDDFYFDDLTQDELEEYKESINLEGEPLPDDEFDTSDDFDFEDDYESSDIYEGEAYEEVEEVEEIEGEPEIEEAFEEEFEEAEEVEEIEEEPEIEEAFEEEFEEAEEVEEIEEEPKIYVKPEVDIAPEPGFMKDIDFPVFRSSLFPNYNNETKTDEKNFTDVMNEEQKRMQDNLLKEEQMQREAEALLASLGIDLGSITPSGEPLDDIDESMFGGISRDDLKKALVIDSEKKEIIKRLKEFR